MRLLTFFVLSSLILRTKTNPGDETTGARLMGGGGAIFHTSSSNFPPKTATGINNTLAVNSTTAANNSTIAAVATSNYISAKIDVEDAVIASTTQPVTTSTYTNVLVTGIAKENADNALISKTDENANTITTLSKPIHDFDNALVVTITTTANANTIAAVATSNGISAKINVQDAVIVSTTQAIITSKHNNILATGIAKKNGIVTTGNIPISTTDENVNTVTTLAKPTQHVENALFATSTTTATTKAAVATTNDVSVGTGVDPQRTTEKHTMIPTVSEGSSSVVLKESIVDSTDSILGSQTGNDIKTAFRKIRNLQSETDASTIAADKTIDDLETSTGVDNDNSTTTTYTDASETVVAQGTNNIGRNTRTSNTGATNTTAISNPDNASLTTAANVAVTNTKDINESIGATTRKVVLSTVTIKENVVNSTDNKTANNTSIGTTGTTVNDDISNVVGAATTVAAVTTIHKSDTNTRTDNTSVTTTIASDLKENINEDDVSSSSALIPNVNTYRLQLVFGSSIFACSDDNNTYS